MIRKATALLLLFGIYTLKAQIIPADGSKLNYTQVMLEYDKVPDATAYLIQMIEDDGIMSFDKPKMEISDNSTATLVSNLEFGKKYIWRSCGLYKKKQGEWNGPYHFEIVNNDAAERLSSVLMKNDTAQCADGLLTLDHSRLIVDRSGEPVWYLPPTNDLFSKPHTSDDLRITDAGTLTFKMGSSVFECNLNGDILWTGPR